MAARSCFAAVALCCASVASAARSGVPNASPIGANIDGIADWSNSLQFVNIVRQSRTWGSAESPWDGNATVGADSWPNQSSFGNCFYGPQGGSDGPTTLGTWLISFEGTADVVPLGMMHGATIANQSYDAATDTTTASLVISPDPESCNCIVMAFYNASTKEAGPGIKDLNILQPGYALAQADDFATPFLALLGRVDVLRFMDWANVIGNLIEDWADRPLPSRYSYTSGVPWEVCFKFANTLMIDPWINVPAHASDDYVLQLATLAKALVDPSLSIYLEFSNEVWNWGYEESHYALAAANASVYAGDPYQLNATGLAGDGNPGYWMARWFVAKTKAHGDIFRTVFGDDAVGKDKRIRPVYAWQCGNTHDTVGLPYLLQIYGEPARFLHSVAIAPYMTIGDIDNSPTLTVDQVLAGWRSYQQNISIDGTGGITKVNYVAQIAAAAAYWGLYVQAYEAGPDTVEGLDSGPALWAKANASADPRIEPIVFDYLQSWHAYGAQMGPLNYFIFGAGTLDDQYGIYEVLQDMGKFDTPKLAAIDRSRAAPIVVSSAIPAIPATLNASFFVGHPVPATPNGFSGWPDDVDYLVQTPAPLRVTVTLSAGCDDPATANMTIALGGAVRNVQTVECPSSGDWAKYVPCAPSAPFDVPAGVSVFRVHRGRPWLGVVDVAVVA